MGSYAFDTSSKYMDSWVRVKNLLDTLDKTFPRESGESLLQV